MIVSSSEAKERLESERNRLAVSAPGSERVSDVAPASKDLPVPDSSEGGEEGQDQSKESSAFDFSELDKIIDSRPCRPSYANNLPAQRSIAQTSLLIGQTSAAHIFGNSVPQVHAYENGLQSSAQITNGKPVTSGIDKIVKELKQELALKAATRLGEVLDVLDGDRIKRVKRATDLARVGKDMAVILDKVSPREDHMQGGVHFHIIKPETAPISDYKVIEVGSRPAD